MNIKLQSTQIPESQSELRNLLVEQLPIEDTKEFFNPRSPFELTLEELDFNKEQIRLGVKRLLKARENKESVLIFGDYDADGISATAILWEILDSEDFRVLPFIPHRAKHGYGLSMKAIDEILESQEKPDLVITVDNGIVAHEEVARLQEAGIDVIVTDHHGPEATLPEAAAVIHSTKLCGATVAWIFARELLAALEVEGEELLRDELDLCALATIADLVPLLEANRSFATHGLEALRNTSRVGLLALSEHSGIDLQTLDTYGVNFQIAPRINAMGRLEHGLDALRLLCTKKKDKAIELSSHLSQVNEKRQTITYDALTEAEALVSESEEKLLIVSSTDYHEGVIGLVAGKLVERFYRPSIAISIDGELAKGSARSIKGFHITDFLRESHELFESLGGHPMAAGFSAKTENLPEIIRVLQQQAHERLDDKELERSQTVACELPESLLTLESVSTIDDFAPFGQANRRPKFLIKNAILADFQIIGKTGKHLKLIVEIGQQRLEALFWNAAEKASGLELGQELQLVVSLERNEWRGRSKLQLVVRDAN